MRKALVVGLVLAIALSTSAYVMAGDEAANPAPQTKCPVTGMPIDREVFTDYEGMRVYLCCAGVCEEEFMKEPARYIKEFEEQGITIEKTPDVSRDNRGG